jgi:hypothetical protein
MKRGQVRGGPCGICGEDVLPFQGHGICAVDGRHYHAGGCYEAHRLKERNHNA